MIMMNSVKFDDIDKTQKGVISGHQNVSKRNKTSDQNGQKLGKQSTLAMPAPRGSRECVCSFLW